MSMLNDVFPEWETAGIFTALNNFSVPWKTSVDAIPLNIAYHGARSGNKTVSPLINRYVDSATGQLSTENVNKIANMLITVYGAAWGNLYDLLSLEYDPIQNYSMTETENGTDTHTGTGTGSDSETHTGTDAHETENTQNTNAANTSGVYGFNSATAVNDSTQNGNGTNSETGSDTETRNLSDSGSYSKTEMGNDSHTRTLTRAGNIGVTTSQQMIESSIQLWKWHFFETVFEDIDKFLVLRIY